MPVTVAHVSALVWSGPAATALVAAVFAVGLLRMRRRPPPLRVAAFLAALTALGLALAPPVERLTDELFVAHMAQHLLLLLVAAPLLVTARPAAPLLLALPAAARRPLAQLRRHSAPTLRRAHPFAAAVAFVAVVWLWHLPALYAAAVRHALVHAIEHASFLAAGGALWWAVARSRRGDRPAWALLCLVGVTLATGVLGALLAFSGEPVYPPYDEGTGGSLSPLQDQRAAGLLMWIPSTMVYALAAAGIFLRWLQGFEPGEAVLVDDEGVVADEVA